jgi:hypothetical protein
MNTPKRDLHNYDSPIRDINGTVPYNNYLWPTEAWWPCRDPAIGYRVDSRHHFGIVALSDGRFATDGDLHHILRSDGEGLPIVFADRTAAIRTAAARMLGVGKAARHWNVFTLRPDDYAKLYNWTIQAVAQATSSDRTPRLTSIPEPPPRPAPESDLPLWQVKYPTLT